MHLTPAMVDDLMAIEPLAAHDLLNGVKQELSGLPVGRRHVPGAQRTDEGATKLAMGRSGASIGAPGAMLNCVVTEPAGAAARLGPLGRRPGSGGTHGKHSVLRQKTDWSLVVQVP